MGCVRPRARLRRQGALRPAAPGAPIPPPCSEEIGAVVTTITGVEHSKRTEEDIKKWFSRADYDKE